ncbi:hypothetical protein Uis1B_1922 [Bifidobacterium margollesii]|uniref:Uncharacterized protein n=2 Tax=Bifidobacterium margollesii TaxID=2020964 RepID=A0A2N5J7R8_9BIFI|nr:hypothetical protein Uis1B_1922 [Bifidobacterium margollesii]
MGIELQLKDIFVKNIEDKIDGVVKASDDSNLEDEVREYVLTNEIQTNLERFLDTYNDPSADYTNGVWISGFFGSGKSHLLKILSHILGDAPEGLRAGDAAEPIGRAQVVEIMKAKARDADNHVLEGLLDANLRIPATSLLFNIDSKGQKGSKTVLMDAFIRVFDEARGYYGANKYVAKLERDLESNGCLDEFTRQFEQIAGKPWSRGRTQAAFSGPKIDRAFSAATGDEVTGILKDYQKQYNPTIADFADDVNDWLQHQPDNHRIIFLVDEVGQFIGSESDLMLNLQTVTEELFSRTNGRVWVIVTSQEDIDAVIGDRTVSQGLDFTKIKGRFAIDLKLSSADAIEVIQKRLLTKNEQGETASEELWRRHRDELNTLFSFQGEGGVRQFRNLKFGTEEDFTATYPFINYQFALFQDAMRGMSAADFFEGQHRSVGERSLLSTISSALVECKNRPVGSLVPFSALYDGIAGTIQSAANHRINEASREFDTRTESGALTIALLKALLLVKHVRGFKANVRNLRILVLDRFDVDLPGLEERIRRTLDDLEQKNYVHRTGDEYEYLTNDEQAVESEIKNLDVDDNSIRGLMKQIINEDVLRMTHVDYGQGRHKTPFRFGLMIDNIGQGRTYPIALHIVTPMNDMNLGDKILQSSGERSELRVILSDDDPTLMRDLAMYERTEKYVRLHSGEQGPRKRIIDDKRSNLEFMRAGLKIAMAEALKAATLAYNGAVLGVKAKDDAVAIVTEALQTLIGRLYTNFDMVSGLAYAERDLPDVLANATNTIPMDGSDDSDFLKDNLDLPSQEVFDYIAGELRNKLAPTVGDVIRHYEDVPYGWSLGNTLACLCHLYGGERIHLLIDGKRIPRTDVVRNLTNQRKTEAMRVEIPKAYNPANVKELRDFANEYLNLTAANLPVDVEDMAAAVKNGLVAEIGKIEDLRREGGRFAFASQLDEPLRRLRAVAAMSEAWLLESFPNRNEANSTEQLLDDKEDVVDPIRKLLRGVQRESLVSGLDWIGTNDSNFTLASAELQRERDRVRVIVDDPMLFQGNRVNRFNKELAQLKAHLETWIGAERESALAIVQTVRESIIGIDSYRNADEDAQRNALLTLDNAAAKINGAKYVADIRQTADAVKGDLYLTLVNQLDAASDAARRQTGPQPEAQPGGNAVRTDSDDSSNPGDSFEPADGVGAEPKHAAVSPEPESKPVNRNVRVTPPRPKPMLTTENDVDEFLDEYRRRLIATIREGKRILL